MQLIGNISKMQSENQQLVQYWLPVGEERLALNPIIGGKLQLTFTGNINCIQCGRKTNKSFQQGFCFPCNRKLMECNMCTIHPERCLVYEGNCDPNDWAHAHCSQPQIVYLANTSAVKVGITRTSQIPTRWIDQGATQALPIFKAQNRYQVGLLEVALKQHIADKTNWRRMLQGDGQSLDLVAEKQNLLQLADSELKQIQQQYTGEIELLENQTITELNYPVQIYPTKVNSHSFDKIAEVSGTLLGIKGQYVIFDTGVLNIRKFGGYELEVKSSLPV